MNYRHLYHAGNFADVVKHSILIAILRAYQRKDSPFCYVDTHAGIGLYPLYSDEAQKKQEYTNGIVKLLSHPSPPPDVIQQYLDIVNACNVGELQFYPGSPWIADNILREDDRAILCELHPDDYETLKRNCASTKRIAVHHTDGYLGLKAFVPPAEKRGVVMIDPPFEITNEFEKIALALKGALKHWRSGCYFVWYPLKNLATVNNFYRDMIALKTPAFAIHFTINEPVDEGKLSACGMLLVNPPWQVQALLETTVLPYIADALDARFEIKTLVA